MQIELTNIAKRYNYEWIFQNLNYTFSTGDNYVLLGANGSGKSTLLQIIAGYSIPSEGRLSYVHINNRIHSENIYSYISIAAPYLELFDEFTLEESVLFQQKCKPFIPTLSVKEIIEILELEKSAHKQLKYFSSGMRQRVKLGLAILSNTPLLLLDEPASNLDKEAIAWYQHCITKYAAAKLIIVCSNQQEYEYAFCNKKLIISDFKPSKSSILSIR